MKWMHPNTQLLKKIAAFFKFDPLSNMRKKILMILRIQNVPKNRHTGAVGVRTPKIPMPCGPPNNVPLDCAPIHLAH